MRRERIDIAQEPKRLDRLAGRLFVLFLVVGLVGMGAGYLLSGGGAEGQRRFLSSYLVTLTYFLSLSLGALFFVILHHLVRAGWSVVVRRLAEAIAANLWLLGLLFIPILAGMEQIYPWSRSELVATDPILQHKSAWLNPTAFTIRCAVYFGTWTLLSQYFLRRSVAQDATGNVGPTIGMERLAGPAMLLYGITVSFAAFDILMSLDPHWFSTIFGVYLFSGSVLGFLALLPILVFLLQRAGRLTGAITREHYHDMGKLIFAFTIFWAYIAFSQYMLIWYANLPEETHWYLRRQEQGWTSVSLLLVLGHFLIPFLILMPRFVKRSGRLLFLPALWVLVMHWFDIYWLVMPQLSATRVPWSPIDAAITIGMGGIFLAAATHRLRNRSLVPEKDPRIEESLAIESV